MTRYIKESEAIFETELTNLTKLYPLPEELTMSNAELFSMNEQLEELFREEKPNAECEATEYSDKGIDQTTRVRCQINELERAETSTVTTTEQEAVRQLTRTIFSSASGLRSPMLELPMFEGALCHWLTFWKHYEAAIHSKASLSTMKKFQYTFGGISQEKQLRL